MPSDIRAPITDNQTWNNCPQCGKAWPDKKATPGLLHRTRLCAKCERKSDGPRTNILPKVSSGPSSLTN